jgi:hypothetical protein
MVLNQVLLAGVLLFPGLTAAALPLQNGGFENDGASAAPMGWVVVCSGGCKESPSSNTATKAEGRIRLASLFESPVALSPGLTPCVYYIRSGSASKTGPNRLDLDLSLDGKQYVAQTATPLSTADKDALDLISAQEKRAPGLEAQLTAVQAEGIPAPYPRSDLAIARLFCQYCRDDVAHARHARALQVAQEVKQLLDRAEKEMRAGLDVPVLKRESPITIRDGSFYGACAVGGHDEQRPVFLTGYGHFPPVVEDLPVFPNIGISVIQIEIGPSSTVFEDGVRTDAIQSFILPALDRARDNSVRICLLISPHYFPEWAFKRWPDLRVQKSGFLQNTLDAPQVREIYAKHLGALIPLIKDHPALHSICLSNEPVSENAENDPWRRPLWRKYIERRHKTIEALNAAYGTHYASFDEVPHPRLAFDEKPGPLYDAVRCNQECFAEWHAWMVDVIHRMAPDLPCHAKVMVLPKDRGTVFWGADPWDFARLSQINGNDCYFLQLAERAPWASEWLAQNMYYDLQRSMKRVPIFNTENHIIRDREQGDIHPNHIYAAIWQGAIHGQGASTTWAWQRTYDEKADFEGLILHRAACTAAMSRCALDLMRLSKEVAALQNIEPRVALLYSHAATIRDKRHVPARAQVYEALNFCGIPIGFITDEQIAAGLLRPYACLIVTAAQAASLDAIEGIRKYIAEGGRVLAYGSPCLTMDEYGRPATTPTFSATLDPQQGKELRDILLTELEKAGIHPEITLRTPDGALPYGVEWRSAAEGGRTVLNMINLTRQSVQVNLPQGPWTDLVTRTPLANPVKLDTNAPVLASRS